MNQTDGNYLSLAGCSYSRTRRRPCHFRPLLPMDIPPTAQNHGAVLGFLPALRGGEADKHFEDQYRAAAVPRGIRDGDSCDPGICIRCMGTA